jgi:hypothetical protein
LIVPVMYFFVKIDWNHLFEQRRLRLRAIPKNDSSL